MVDFPASIKYLEKQFGPGIVMTLDGAVEKKDCITSGHPFIDYVLGGGFYFGKHHEIFGYESAGKSTLAYQVAIQCQKMMYNTGRVLLLDYENAWSKSYFELLGGKTTGDSFVVSQPETAEDGLEVARVFIDGELVDLIIVDSVSAMMPKAEEAIYVNTSGKEVDIDKVTDKTKQVGHMGQAKIGSQSLVMSQGLKQLSSRINRKKVCMIWINQIRTKIATGKNQKTKDTTSGGNALRFYAAVRIELRKVGSVTGKLFDPFENKVKDNQIVAIKTIVRGAKNKEAPPFREAPIEVRFGQGIDVEKGILDFAVDHKLIVKGGGGWYMTEGVGASRNARGIEDFRKLMKKEPEVWKGLLAKCDFGKAMDGKKSYVVEVDGEEQVPDVPAPVDVAVGDAVSAGDVDVDELMETSTTKDVPSTLTVHTPESVRVSKAQAIVEGLPDIQE